MIGRSLAFLVVCVGHWSIAASAEDAKKPVPIIFDTDLGNDCDDVQALAIIHALQSRGECELLAVTITKDHELAAPFADAVNTFYGRSDVPIGVCRSGVTPEQGRYNGLAAVKDGDEFRYPHDLISGNTAPDAVQVLRKALADAEDGSVVIAQVGFSTNLRNLLDTPADSVSDLNGTELIKKKVRLLSIMAGAFEKIPKGKNGELVDHREYNVVKDLPSSTLLANAWPTPIVWSGYEIGLNLRYPQSSVENDYGYVPHHPVAEAYMEYITPPHDRPTWDLTSVLYGIRPNAEYFDISEPGRVTVDAEGLTIFEAKPDGRDRYLILREDQKPRALEALKLLSSQPPSE